jgi:hypothetical protein
VVGEAAEAVVEAWRFVEIPTEDGRVARLFEDGSWGKWGGAQAFGKS